MTVGDAAAVRENVAHIARGCRAHTSHNPAVHEQAIDAALDRLQQELDDANEGITEQATMKLAALERAEEAEAAVNQMMEARDNWHTAYVRERAEAGKLRAAIQAAINELGVPSAGYPAPVANAWEILSAVLAGSDAPPTLSGGDPGEVHPPQSHAERQAELNGPSGSPISPPEPVLERIAARIEAGELLSDKSMSDGDFLAPLLGDAAVPAERET